MTVKKYVKHDEQQLSEHFRLSEFHCHCNYPECSYTLVDTDLVDYLEKKRAEFNAPIHLNCGYRCSRYNHEKGGANASQHMLGKAADIVVKDMSAHDVADKCEDADGLGRYANFTHVDVRGHKSRWNG